MSDVLVYLHALVRRCVAMQMPSELRDVVDFLQGKSYCQTRVHTSKQEGGGERCIRAPFGLVAWHRFTPLAIAAANTYLPSAVAASEDSASVLYDYLIHHGFDRVVSVRLIKDEQSQAPQSSTIGTSDVPVLVRGEHVGKRARTQEDINSTRPTTSYTSRDEGSGGVPCGVTVIGGTVSVEAAREACVETIRTCCTAAERTSTATGIQEEEALASRDNNTRSTTTTATRETMSNTRAELRRVLVVIHCHTDNRHAISVQSINHTGSSRRTSTLSVHGPGSTQGTRNGAASPSAPSATRHRYGSDVLQLLLHDLTSVMTLHEVRLQAAHTTGKTTCRVQLSVLIVPEDYSYGGAVLARRLHAELGDRYVVRLFPDEEAEQGKAGASMPHNSTHIKGRSDSGDVVDEKGQHRDTHTSHTSNGSSGACRTRRLLSLWQPAALASSAYSTTFSHGGSLSIYTTTTISNGVVAMAEVGTSEEEKTKTTKKDEMGSDALALWLLREPSCFFLRESNHLLALFLSEALRRFPLLVPPNTLRAWRLAWTLRHSLSDVVFAFHDALMPFTLSHRVQEMKNNSVKQKEEEEKLEEHVVRRRRTDALAVYQDTVLLLNALLQTAAALGPNDEADTAVMFMLLYSELAGCARKTSSNNNKANTVARGESSVPVTSARLMRAPCLVQALATIYDREHWYNAVHQNKYALRSTSIEVSLHDSEEDEEDDGDKTKAGMSAQEKATVALHSLLPFAHPYTSYTEDSTSSGGSDEGKENAVNDAVHEVDRLSLRLPVTAALRQSALTALMPPAASLRELHALSPSPPPSHDDHEEHEEGERTQSVMSDNNFYNPHVPHAIRVLYLLTTKARYARREKEKWAALTELQAVCQLSDEALLLVLTELQKAGLTMTNLQHHTARSLLDGV